MQTPTIETLESLGFGTAARIVAQQKEAAPTELRRKLRIAFEHFRVVTPEQAQKFADKLKNKTFTSKTVRNPHYDKRERIDTWIQPVYTRVQMYDKVPPTNVLESLRKAKELDCFDYFEILTLGQARHVEYIPLPQPKDPVLFGRINGSDNRYFIDQWDDDVAIEDILREEEG